MHIGDRFAAQGASFPAFVLMALLSSIPMAHAQNPPGAQPIPALAPLYYTQYCASCHDDTEQSHAPDRDALRQRTPEAIFDALSKGAMTVQGSKLTDVEKRLLATYLSGRPAGTLVTGDASAMPNRCQARPIGNVAQDIAWNGWGRDVTNARFQPTPQLTAAQLPQLKLKWAFAFPNASSAYSQPLVAAGRVFSASDAAHVYSLDAKTGCVYWSFSADSGVRTAMSIGPIAGTGPTRFAVYFGDIQGNVYAVDADNGRLIWRQKTDPHPLARITGAPVLYQGRLYVPVTSLEESSGGIPTYQCCTFRGNVVAYDASTGRQLWKTYSIAEAPQKLTPTSIGTQRWGPSGGGIWSAPAIDAERHVLYVTTGDAYSPTASGRADIGTDAVIAMDLETGRVTWTRQVTPDDVWLVGCQRVRQPGQSETCPEQMGPDDDFGSNASIHKLSGGRSVVIAQQKSGVVWAFDPDKNGEILWRRPIGRGLQFGHASAGDIGFFASAAPRADPELGGVWAIRLATGEKVWRSVACAESDRECVRAHSAAISAIPGVVFAGSSSGVLRAYAAADGKVLWEQDTARAFETVNKVDGKGGAMSGSGPVVAAGLLFVNSGYAAIGGPGAGNVLLAYGVE